MPHPVSAALAVALSVAGLSDATPPVDAGEAPPALELPGDVRAVRARLELEIDPARDGFRGEIALEVRLAKPRRVIWLHARKLSVLAAFVEAGGASVPAAFAQVTPEGVASLTLPSAVGPGPVTLRLRWDAPWGALKGLYLSRAGPDRYASTQLEAVDAREVFPAFDEPAAKIPWEVSLVVPEGLVAVSNQPEVEATAAGDGTRRVRFSATRPLPSYLLFFAVGPFDVVTPPPLPPNEVRGRPLPVRGLAPRGRGKDLAFALQAGAASLAAQERYFGVPFPYDKLDHVAIPDFAAGGMENAGAIAYRESVLLFTEDRSPEQQKRRIAGLVAHEIGHQWFGDLVTLGWWTDVWLNEAFATWVVPKGTGMWRPEWRPELSHLRWSEEAMGRDGLASARPIRQPLARLGEVGLQFDAMSYQKGAAVLAMFERFAGPERFREAIRGYLLRHSDGVAATADFLAAISGAAGRDLAPAFATFLDQPGVPLVRASLRCEPGPDGAATVLLDQSRWQPRGASPGGGGRWKIPVCVRAGHRSGASQEACTLLEEERGVLALEGPCPAWFHPNAGGAGYYRFALPGPDLAALLDHGLGALAPAERISLGQSLAAARQAGLVPYADLLAAVASLARDLDPEVAFSVRPVLEEARDRLVPPASRAAVEAVARGLYRPAFDRLGWTPRPGEAHQRSHERAELFEFLVLTGRDPALRREAARRARAFLGLDGPPRLDALPTDLVLPSLAVAVQDGGRPVFDAILARVPDARGPARVQLLAAVRHTTEPALFARAWALRGDPGLSLRERIDAVTGWPEDAQDLVAEAFLADVDGVARLIPGEFTAALPKYAGTPCDASRAARIREALAPRAAAEPSMSRPLEQEQEAIRICLAGREADGEAAARAYRALAGRGKR